VISPKILAEWPEVGRPALEATAGDPAAVVDLVAERTHHTKTLVKRQLAEIIGEAHAPSPLESRLLRVLHALEATVEPLEAEADRLVEKAARVAEDVGEQGRAIVRDARREVDAAERTLRGNFWTTLFVTLGLGVVAGLFLGRHHDRR
jgi:ElaB/YqjD/DUF883 family membrane-anchored ribosome-binding protein